MTVNYNPSIVTSGLILCLDAGNANSYPGTGTTWTDVSRNDNNGTLVNTPTYSSLNSGNLIFNGTNQYGSTPLSLGGYTAFTLSAWIKTTTASKEIMATYGVTNIFEFWINPNKTASIYTYGSSTAYRASATVVGTGSWFYCVGVYSAATTTLNMYVNGVLDNGTLTGTIPASVSAGASTVVIGNVNSGSYYFNGSIGQVAIYNRALSAAEVSQNFNALRGRYVITNGLVLYLDAGNTSSYPGTGTTWTDLSGNGNNATLVNSPTFDSTNGGSIVFNGTNNYVILPNGLLSGTGDFTINQWIKSLSTGNNGTIFANYPSGNLQIFYGQKFFGIYLGTAIYACSVNPCAYYTSNWSMITALRSGTSVGLYLNGVLVYSGTTANSIGTAAAIFRLGTNTSTGEQFTGNISVTQVYNRALTASEITQNFNDFRGRYGI